MPIATNKVKNALSATRNAIAELLLFCPEISSDLLIACRMTKLTESE